MPPRRDDRDNLGREEISNRSEIEKLLNEIKDAAMGFENYKQYFDKVRSSDQVIMTQIENLQREYREYKLKFQEGYNKDNHKQLIEDGFVKLEVFDDARQMTKIVVESYAWKTLQQELYSITFQKICRVLDDARALDIKRDALKGMREMEEKRQAMFVEIMNNMSSMFKDYVVAKIQNYDDKFINLVMLIDEDDRKERRAIFGTLQKVVDAVTQLPEETKEVIKSEIDLNSDSKKQRMYPQGRTPIAEEFKSTIKPIVQPTTSKRNQRSTRDEEDDESAAEIMRKLKKNNVKMDDIDEAADFDEGKPPSEEDDDFA